MTVLVETNQGRACICGDVIYDIQNQIVEPLYQILEIEPQPTGNHATTKREEKAAVKKALQNAFVLPVHDYPARLEAGGGGGRLGGAGPGPEEAGKMKAPRQTAAVIGMAVLPPELPCPTCRSPAPHR